MITSLLSQYTVELDDIKPATTIEKIKTFFAQHGEIHDVQISRVLKRLFGNFKDLRDLEKDLKNRQLEIETDPNAKPLIPFLKEPTVEELQEKINKKGAETQS